MNVEPFNARERWIAAAALLLILLLLGSLRSSGQELSSFTETNALRAADKVPIVTAASGSNVNQWITYSNVTLQVLGGLRAGAGFTLTTNASNQTVTIAGSTDAALSNNLVAIINTASNANATRTTTASNVLQTWVTLNSNNVDSVSNNFRTADTALSNSLAIVSNQLPAKLDATNGMAVDLSLTNTTTNYGTISGAGVGSVVTNMHRVMATNIMARTYKVNAVSSQTDTTNRIWALFTRLVIAGSGNGVQFVNAGNTKTLLNINETGETEFPNTNAVHFSQANTNTTATSGSGTLPANPLGFLLIQVNGAWVKVPYYLP